MRGATQAPHPAVPRGIGETLPTRITGVAKFGFFAQVVGLGGVVDRHEHVHALGAAGLHRAGQAHLGQTRHRTTVALLAGYAYAHATSAWLGIRGQTLVHLALLAVPVWAIHVLGGVFTLGRVLHALGLSATILWARQFGMILSWLGMLGIGAYVVYAALV